MTYPVNNSYTSKQIHQQVLTPPKKTIRPGPETRKLIRVKCLVFYIDKSEHIGELLTEVTKQIDTLTTVEGWYRDLNEPTHGHIRDERLCQTKDLEHALDTLIVPDLLKDIIRTGVQTEDGSILQLTQANLTTFAMQLIQTLETPELHDLKQYLQQQCPHLRQLPLRTEDRDYFASIGKQLLRSLSST